MSRLREQFKRIPSPRDNNFAEGGSILDWLSEAGTFIKKGLKSVTEIARDIIDATGGDKGLIGSMLTQLVKGGATEDDMSGIVAAILNMKDKDDSGIDFSSIPELPELTGFAGSGGIKSVQPGDMGKAFESRFPGENLVGGQNTNLSKLSSQNTIFNPKQYMQYTYEGPKGTNIKIG